MKRKTLCLVLTSLTIMLMLGAGLPISSSAGAAVGAKPTGIKNTPPIFPATAASYTDTIAVKKTAARAPGCRAYEVTLEITGTPPPEKPVDVILVIDRSGSMKDGSPRSAMEYAKEAARSFAGQVLQNSNNRVAVVSFAYPGTTLGHGAQSDARTDLNFSSSNTQVKNIISGLKADGGTNSEAGFLQAKTLMMSSGRSEVVKAIVFLTDGVPTVSNGQRYGPSDPTVHNTHTRAAYEAGQGCHALGYQVFTVNLLTGVPGKCQEVARDTMTRAQNAGYYETNSAADLSAIYDQISQVINYSAKNAMVVDKIPTEHFEFMNFTGAPIGLAPQYDPDTGTITWDAGTIGTGTVLKYKIRAKENFGGGSGIPTNVEAILTYTDINGNPEQNKVFPVPTVDVPPPLIVNAGPDREVVLGASIGIGDNLAVSGGTGPYTYRWSCDSAPGWFSTEQNPEISPEADAVYTIEVRDSFGCFVSDQIEVTVLKGTITINKVVQKGSKTKKFAIIVQGEGLVWSMLLADGESALITGLEPGSYSVREVVPMGYALTGITLPSVTIGPDSPNGTVTITNKKVKTPWFWDEDEKVNTFTVRAAF